MQAELIQSRGYQVETHLVTTDDGYILKMLRIPANNPNSKAVFLQHGVIDSDATFLITPKSNSLGTLELIKSNPLHWNSMNSIEPRPVEPLFKNSSKSNSCQSLTIPAELWLIIVPTVIQVILFQNPIVIDKTS